MSLFFYRRYELLSYRRQIGRGLSFSLFRFLTPMNQKLEQFKIKIKIARDDVMASPASAFDRSLFEFADSMSSRNVVISDDKANNDNVPDDSKQ